MSRGVIIALSLLAAVTVSLYFYLSADDPSQYLVLATWGTPNEVASFQHLIDHYNATWRPKHRVKLSHSELAAYTERLLVQAAARSLPDVIHIDQKDLPLFVHKGLLEDITPVLARDSSFDTGIFLPHLVPPCRVGGRFYGIPHNFSTFVLYYNRDHFDAEGVSYPDSTWTWDTLLQAARRLTKRDAAGKTIRYGCFVTIITFTMIYQNGGATLSPTLDTCVIASPEAEGALQFVTDLSEKYGVTWNILAQNLQWDDMFAGGRLSMITNGRWAAAWYMRSMSSGTVDVAPLPRGKLRKGAAVNHMMSISAQSAKKEEAWEFIKFLVSDEGQRMVNEDGANIPAVRSIVYSDEFVHHRTTPTMNNRIFLEELTSSVGWPFDQGPYLTYHTLSSQMDLASRRILLGQATVMQSLAMMQDHVNRVIEGQRREPEPKPFVGSVVFYLSFGIPASVALAAWTHHRRKHSRET